MRYLARGAVECFVTMVTNPLALGDFVLGTRWCPPCGRMPSNIPQVQRSTNREGARKRDRNLKRGCKRPYDPDRGRRRPNYRNSPCSPDDPTITARESEERRLGVEGAPRPPRGLAAQAFLSDPCPSRATALDHTTRHVNGGEAP